jgi:hypothetical protein
MALEAARRAAAAAADALKAAQEAADAAQAALDEALEAEFGLGFRRMACGNFWAWLKIKRPDLFDALDDAMEQLSAAQSAADAANAAVSDAQDKYDDARDARQSAETGLIDGLRESGMMSEYATPDGNLSFSQLTDGVLSGMLRDAGLPDGWGVFRNGDSYHLAERQSSRHQEGQAYSNSRSGTLDSFRVRGDNRRIDMYTPDKSGVTPNWSDDRGNRSSWSRAVGR